MMFQTISILGMALIIAAYTGIALAEMQINPIHNRQAYQARQANKGLNVSEAGRQAVDKLRTKHKY